MRTEKLRILTEKETEMVLFIIIMLILAFVISIVFVVVTHIKKTEKQKYYAAAGNILREEFLNYALQNTISSEVNIPEPKGAKMMIYLKSKSAGKKSRFVFDPEKIVKIGRNSSESNIYINERSVSQNHCRIYSSENRVYLQDLNSANGTEVIRGAFKKYAVFGGQQIELRTGDKIKIGSVIFSVCLFYYDLTIM